MIVFAFLYQKNVPEVYFELENRSINKMNGVTITATVISTLSYIIIGTFGYLIFSTQDNPDEMLKDKNILQAKWSTF